MVGSSGPSSMLSNPSGSRAGTAMTTAWSRATSSGSGNVTGVVADRGDGARRDGV